jgi:hypothetical protein
MAGYTGIERWFAVKPKELLNIYLIDPTGGKSSNSARTVEGVLSTTHASPLPALAEAAEEIT